MSIFNREYEVETGGNFDVIVAGGGVAGIAAALAAARQGCSVLLLEKNCTLGGLATAGLVNLFVPMCNGRGIPIMRGMAEEFLRDSVRYGFNTLNPAWIDNAEEKDTTLRYVTFFSPQLWALQLLEKLLDSGVKVLYNAVVEEFAPDRKGLIVLCEEGHRFYGAGKVVDATGSALLFHRAGAPTELGKNYFSYHGYAASLDSCAKALEKQNIRYLFSWRKGGNANLYGANHPEGMEYFYGDTSENITRYLRENQLLLLKNLKSESPESRELLTLPSMPQLRTVRRIQGEYTLSEADIFRHFDDSVTALCDSELRDSLYEVPYRALYCNTCPDLVAAGRNISSTGYLWDVTRVIPPAIVTGQAAGCAAALAVKHDCSIPAVPVAELQHCLAGQGVLVHFKDEWIPESRCAGEFSPASHSHPDRGKER